MGNPIISKATITFAQGLMDLDFLVASGGSAKADLVFDDGSEDTFAWYHDEISFTEADFVGRSMAEVRETFMKRDMAWLRS